VEISASSLKKIGLLLLIVMIGIGSFVTRSAWWPRLFPSATVDAAGPQLTPDLAKQRAEKAALAFYTVDYTQEGTWFADFKEDSYYTSFEKLIKPALWPIFTTANLKSVARLEGDPVMLGSGADKFTKRLWEVYRINLSVDQLWPGVTPPRPFNVPSIVTVTWPQAPQFTVFVLVSETAEQTWEVGMFPSQKIAEQFVQSAKPTSEAPK
jgi:hypothetical protein